MKMRFRRALQASLIKEATYICILGFIFVRAAIDDCSNGWRLVFEIMGVITTVTMCQFLHNKPVTELKALLGMLVSTAYHVTILIYTFIIIKVSKCFIHYRYNLCRNNYEETRQVCQLILERVYTPCLDNVPEYFEHIARVMMDGMWLVNPIMEAGSLLYLTRHLGEVPGYILTESDRIAIQARLREQLKGKNQYLGKLTHFNIFLFIQSCLRF